MHSGDVSAAWEDNAQQWLAWAGTPDHDVYFWKLNLPALLALLPAAGTRTLDVGCGEGRLGRILAKAGHRLSGIDSSPTLAAATEQSGAYEEIVCGDAAALPWPANHFDLAIAFMSLQDMPRPATVIREVARVLEPSGLLLVAIVHPLNRSDAALAEYFNRRRFVDVVERRGREMTFVGIDRPLESYTLALSEAGFVIERLREPRPTRADAAGAPELAPALDKPFFAQLRCRLDNADRWRSATPILETERLVLEPLRLEHAIEMAPVLDDVALHRFTGGQPPTADELRERYARQIAGRSPNGRDRWHNWIARRLEDQLAVGFVQATVADADHTAELGWTIGAEFQRSGYAREATGAMADWLAADGARRLTACIHPEHEASQRVARAIGLAATTELRNGETVWTRNVAGAQPR